MASKKQKARIHILKDQLGMSESDYRSMLGSYGVESSADDDFTFGNAEDMIDTLQRELNARMNSRPGNDHGWGKYKYEYLRPRPADMADPKQLRKIEAIWREVADNPTDAALENMLDRQVGIKKLIWLKKKHIPPVMLALENMKEQSKAKTKK